MFPIVRLEKVLHYRKEFITISDSIEYKRCRVMSNRKGVVLRDEVKGLAINTKKQQVCKEGDFIVAEIDAKVGGYGFVPSELDGAIVSSHYYLFELDQSKILSEYLSFLIKTDIIQNQITSKGSTNYAAIRARDVLAFSIPLPDINIQRHVIELLNYANDKYQLLLGQINSQLSYIQLLREAILQEAVQGKLALQDPTDEPATELLKRIKAEKAKQAKKSKTDTYEPITETPYEIPNGWVWCKLNELTILITKGSSPKWQGVEYVEDGLLFITSENVESFKIKLSNKKFVQWKFNEIEPRSILKKGDFLMNIVGASIGRTARYDLNEIANINQAVCLLRVDSKEIVSDYLLYFFNSKVCKNYMFDRQVDNARANLSMGSISNFAIPIPPLKEQKRIVAKVEQLMQLCDELEAQVQLSKTDAKKLMQALLIEAFEGKEVVRVQRVEKQNNSFREIQSLWYILAAKKNIPTANYFGEMGLAKETFIIDRIFNVNTGFNYVNWHWGPYDPAMRKILNAKNSYFVRKGDPNRGYIDIDQNKSATIEKYPFEDKEKITQAVTELHNIFAAFPSAERSNKIELLATVCKVIEDTRTTDLHTIRNAMTLWKIKDKKVPHNNKAEKFSEKETNACIKFIIDKRWDDKLLN